MDKKELIEFLKDSLKIEIDTTDLYGGRTAVEVCLNLVVANEKLRNK